MPEADTLPEALTRAGIVRSYTGALQDLTEISGQERDELGRTKLLAIENAIIDRLYMALEIPKPTV